MDPICTKKPLVAIEVPMPSRISKGEITALLEMVRGVASARVVERESGEIHRIEISVHSGHDRRRIARDIESALFTGLGMVVDHRTISIVGNGSGNGDGGEVARTLQVSSTGTPAGGSLESVGRIELGHVQWESDGELFCDVRVELTREGTRYTGTMREADTPRDRLMAVGRATIEALGDSLAQETALALEGIEQFAICEQPALVAAIRSRRGRAMRSFVGTALVDGSMEETAARAVLDALNRFWIAESDSAQ